MILRTNKNKDSNNYVWIDVKIGNNQWTLISSSKFGSAFVTKNNSFKRAFNSKIFNMILESTSIKEKPQIYSLKEEFSWINIDELKLIANKHKEILLDEIDSGDFAMKFDRGLNITKDSL